MVTQQSFSQGAYDSTKNQIGSLEDSLGSSATAYSGDTPPTPSDISNDAKLTSLKTALRTMQGQHLNEEWYGKKVATATGQPDAAEPENKSLLTGVLDTLQKPLWGIVGAAESVFGQGAKKGTLENMDENMQTGHRNFGDLLSKSGLPGWVSAPLGFAADVAMDPVNWATAGTEALIPRVASGFIKGTAREGLSQGLEAAGRGFAGAAGETALGTADMASKAASWLTRGAIPKLDETAAFARASEKVAGQTAKYNMLTGTDPLEGLGKGIIGKSNAQTGVTLGNYIEGVVRQMPHGQEIIDKFKYDPFNYFQVVKIKDKVLGLMNKTDDLSTVDASIPEMVEKAGEFGPKAVDISPEAEALRKTFNEAVDDTTHVANAADKTSEIHASDSFDFEQRMKVEAAQNGITEDALKKYNMLQRQKTGIDWWDKLSESSSKKINKIKIGDWKAGEDFMNALDFTNKWFKAAKVPLNPASHVNNLLSGVTMMAMAGFDVSRIVPKMPETYKFLSGAQNADWVYNNFIREATDFSKFAASSPNAVKAAYGFNPSMVGGRYFFQNLVKEGKITGAMTEQEILDAMNKMPDELRGVIENARSASGAEKGTAQNAVWDTLQKNKTFRQDTPSSMIEKAGSAEAAGNASSAITDLNLSGGAGMNYIKQQAAAGNKFYKLVQDTLDKGSSMYERYDQSAKLTLALHMTNDGLTVNEMKKLARMIPGGITKADIIGDPVVKAGQTLHRLTWDKATDIANETLMSYSAMPAFVRMMRSVPVVGAPFVSFTYAMIPKTLKALYHNPEVFNQINQAISEFGGDKTPLEKENLNSKYAAWFKSPGMFRVPFTDSHPMYANLANFLPYYSLTMVNPSNRAYQDALPNTITSIIDKGQLFKDPAGQVLFDYFILPHLLSGADRPESQFGQPLYPINATGLDKAGYAARSLGEAYTPGALGALGVAGGYVAPQATHYVPSYTYRKIAEGMQGNSALGIPSKENPTDLVIKGLAGMAGLPYNKMDLTYLQNNKKK